MAARGSDAGRRRPLASLVALGIVALLLVAVLLALGTWQIHRRSWKLDLIARVDARIHAAPVDAPGPEAWPDVTAGNDEYRHVRATGRFREHADTLVQAVTAYGPGFWLLTPLDTGAGFAVLVNRGFVPSEMRDAATLSGLRVEGETTVTGLLRVTEPGGAFLRSNDPSGDRWYSRDVAAIAAKRGLATTAPFFIDADGPTSPGRYPIGGLTVVSFPNNHLVYALTWYAMAALLMGAVIGIGRREWKARREKTAPDEPA